MKIEVLKYLSKVKRGWPTANIDQGYPPPRFERRARPVASRIPLPLSSDQRTRCTRTQDTPRPEVIIAPTPHPPFAKSFRSLFASIFVASESKPRTTSGANSGPNVAPQIIKTLKSTLQEGVNKSSPRTLEICEFTSSL